MSGSTTVIDALVVTLGLDPAKFVDGEKTATDGLKDIEAGLGKVDEAGRRAEREKGQRDQRSQTQRDRESKDAAKRRADEQRAQDKERSDETRKESEAARAKAKTGQDAAKRQKESWDQAKNAALGFAAAIAGTATAYLVRDTAQDVANTGRLAHNLDMSTGAVTAWGNAVESAVGGNAQAAIGTLGSLSDALVKMQTSGDTSLVSLIAKLEKFSGKTISLKGADGGFVGPEELLKRISVAGQAMDPRLYSSTLREARFDEGSINLTEKGPAAVQAALEAARKRGVASDAEAQADAKLVTEITNLTQTFKRLQQQLVFSFAPDLTRFLADISSMFSMLSGKTSWSDFQAQRKQHWHDAQVEILTNRGMAPAAAEAAVTAAEAAGKDATASTAPNAVPGLLQGAERFLGMPAGSAPATAKPDAMAAPPLPPDIEAEVRKDAAAKGVDPDRMVALFRTEDGGYSKVSPAGAFGPAQLMPGTARMMSVPDGPNAPNYDWHENVKAGVRYYLAMLKRYHGNVEAAEAAYNAGPGGSGVEMFAATGDMSNLPKETSHYVRQIRATLASGSAQAPTSVVNGGDTHTSVNIGQVAVHTQAKDANDVVVGMNAALKAHPLMVQANTGLE